MMELKNFKREIEKYFFEKGFQKKNNSYYLLREGIAIVVGLQRSGYANGYYLNLGYLLTDLNSDISSLKEVDGDVRTRFFFHNGSEETDFYDLNLLTKEGLIHSLDQNVSYYVSVIEKIQDLKLLIEQNPVLLYQTKLVAKKFLGFT